jgi:hypothetical protein
MILVIIKIIITEHEHKVETGGNQWQRERRKSVQALNTIEVPMKIAL